MRLIRRPRWTRSWRFLLALRWSVVLTLIAALVVIGLNVALAQAVGDPPAARTFRAVEKVYTDEGYKTVRELRLGDVEAVQAVTTARTLDTLRWYSGYALAGLFATSLLVGWVLAGRALRPVRTMTQETTRVNARDLSHRVSQSTNARRDDEFGSLARSIDEMLTRLDDAFGRQRRFVDDASHELRTPLAVIRTNVEAVLGRPDVDPEVRDEAVNTTRRAVERMTDLVDDLLASSRASAPEELQDMVRLDELTRDEVADLSVLADARDVRLEVRTEPVELLGHGLAIRRAVDNLLDNAVRMTPRGTTVRVDVEAAEGWAVVRVVDSGPGLSEADAEKVFDRFWQADGHDQRAGHSGLGLSIVRQVAESHGGLARVSSRVGVGSSFELLLPLHPGDVTVLTVPTQRAVGQPSRAFSAVC
jgi:signal transduction histidine kinase